MPGMDGAGAPTCKDLGPLFEEAVLMLVLHDQIYAWGVVAFCALC